MTKVWSNTNQAGFSVVEALLALVTFGVIITGVIGALAYGRQATAGSGDRARAVALADEGVEAIRNIRDAGYANLSDGTFGLAQSGNQWVISGTSDITGIYTRQVTVASGGANRKDITVTVIWATGSVSRQTQVATRLTNWRAPTTRWSNAILAGSLDMPNNAAFRVAIQGNYAYVITSAGSPNFFVIDISQQDAPVQVGSLTLSNSLTNIIVDGIYAYVTTTKDNTELQIVRIDTPILPVLVQSYDAAGNGNANAVQKVGNYVYICRDSNGDNDEFQIIDVTNPTTPTRVGGYGLAQNMRDLYIASTHAFIVTESKTQEILALDITNKAAPSLVSSYDLPGSVKPTGVYGYGDRLYVAHDTELRAMNSADPAALVETGSLATTGSATINGLAVKENDHIVFLATSYKAGSFQVVDASNMAAMSVVRTVSFTGTLNSITYNPMLNIAVGTSTVNAQNMVVFKPN